VGSFTFMIVHFYIQLQSNDIVHMACVVVVVVVVVVVEKHF
jgi:hypothetical protein